MIGLLRWFKAYAKYFLVAWFVLILTASSIPSVPTLKIRTSEVEIRLDYLIHFCEYGSLAFLAFLSFAEEDLSLSKRKYIFITAGLLLFAFIDEFHQKFIPGRTFNINDILSNIAGILAGLAFCIVLFRYAENIIQDRNKNNSA